MQALGLLSCSMSREVRHRVIEGDGPKGDDPEGYDPKGGGPEGDGPEGDVVSNTGTFLNVSDCALFSWGAIKFSTTKK